MSSDISIAEVVEEEATGLVDGPVVWLPSSTSKSVVGVLRGVEPCPRACIGRAGRADEEGNPTALPDSSWSW